MFDLQTFNDFFYGAVTEVTMQQLNKFNEASAGTIRLVPKKNVGDRAHETRFKEVKDLIRRRDPDTNAAVTSSKLSKLDEQSIKVAAGTKPIDIDPGDFDWIQLDPGLGGMVYGEQLARGMPQDQLNTGLSATVAGLSAIGAPSAADALDGVTLDISAAVGGAAVIDPVAMNDTASMFSDNAQAIRAWAMHGLSFHAVMGEALKNAERLFSYETVAIYRDHIGRIFIVTDSPALSNGDGTYNTIGLTEDAVIVEDNGDFRTAYNETTGFENIKAQIQSQWSYNLRLKGISYTAAGNAPTDAQIATPANWEQVVSDIKSTSGVLLKHRIKAA
jgi:hypothetical protein